MVLGGLVCFHTTALLNEAVELGSFTGRENIYVARGALDTVGLFARMDPMWRTHSYDGCCFAMFGWSTTLTKAYTRQEQHEIA